MVRKLGQKRTFSSKENGSCNFLCIYLEFEIYIYTLVLFKVTKLQINLATFALKDLLVTLIACLKLKNV